MPEGFEFVTLSVGAVHPGWATLGEGLEGDILEYNYRGGSHELLIALDRPTEKEIAAIQEEDVHFALVVKGPVLLLLFRFGGLPWGEAAYTIHRVPAAERQLPTPERRGHALLMITLLDRADGRVKALRALTFSEPFTHALETAIVRQADLPYDRYRYEAAIAGIRESFPRIEDLLSESVARCRGGESGPTPPTATGATRTP